MLSFEAFVTLLEESNRAASKARTAGASVPLTNEHWATQADLCALHALRYDFVGHHRAMGRDAKALESMLGLASTPPSGTHYGWEGNRGTSRLLAQYYTSRALISRVSHLFRPDVLAPLNGVSWSAKEVFGSSLPALSSTVSQPDADTGA